MTDGKNREITERKMIQNRSRDDYRRSRSMGPLENRDAGHVRPGSREPRGYRDDSPDRHVSRHVRQPRHLNSGDRSKSRTSRHESFQGGQVIRSQGGKEDRRGRTQVRDGSRNQLMSPPTPAEAEETIAALLPRYVHVVTCHVMCHVMSKWLQ